MGVRRWAAGFFEINAEQSSTRLALILSVGTACLVAVGALALALAALKIGQIDKVAAAIWALGGIILTLGVKTVAAIFGRPKPSDADAPTPAEPTEEPPHA